MNDKKDGGDWFSIIAIGLVLGLVVTLPKACLTDEYKKEHGIGKYHEEQQASDSLNPTEQANDSETGMYAPLIAPEEDELESFVEQLSGAIGQLPPNERDEVIVAIDFLGFSLADYLSETDLENFQNLSESDLLAKTYTRLYRTAREHGDNMSLSKYVELANEFKKVNPEVWEKYTAPVEQP